MGRCDTQKVLEIDPQYGEALHHLAAAYWKLGKKNEAVKYDLMYLEQGKHPGLKKTSRERVAAARTQ